MDQTPQISTVQDLQGLDALETAWQALHQADSEANIFTSWAWIRGRLESLLEPWCILVARSTNRVEGLLALRFPSPEEGTAEDGKTVAMAGSPLADYTGFLCAPGRENVVLTAFAAYLQNHLEWQRLEIRDSPDPRLKSFLGCFEPPRFTAERQPQTPCPFIDLTPYLGLDDGWEAYRRDKPKSRMSRKIRHDLQKIQSLPQLRHTSVEDGDQQQGERQISTLMELWQKRWGQRPTEELAQYRSIFLSSLKANCLWLDILWDDEIPISGRLSFLDHKRRSFCDYITCFDERYAEYSPGIVIAALSIQEAIRRGYHTFDFLRGDEYYKFALGAELRHTENVDVLRCGEQKR